MSDFRLFGGVKRLKRLLGWINRVLGSLDSVLGSAEALKEIKEFVEGGIGEAES